MACGAAQHSNRTTARNTTARTCLATALADSTETRNFYGITTANRATISV